VNQRLLNGDDDSLPWYAGGWQAMVLAVLIAFAVRSYGLSSQNFSNDEIIDLEIARQSWSAILNEPDGFPPLHHLFLKSVLLLTGSNMAGRWLSVAYGVLAVPIVGLLAQRIAGRHCGIVAAGLLAIAPMHVYFSQEGRAYALFFLVSTLAAWSYWRAIELDSVRSWATFALLTSVGGYAHYYFFFVLVALVLIWLKYAMATGKWAPGLAAFSCIGLLSLPVLSLVGSDIGCQQAMRQGTFSFAAVGYTGWSLLVGFCLGPSLRDLHSMSATEAIRGILPWMLPVGFVVCGLIASLLRKTHPYRMELLALLLVPIVGAFFSESFLNLSNYNVRYVIPSLLPLVILMSVALTTQGKKRISVFMGLLVVTLNFFSIMHRQQFTTYQNIDSKGVCEFLVEHSSEPQRVYTIAHYMEVSARHSLPVDYQVIPLDDVTSKLQNLEETINRINADKGSFWIFYSREFHGDPEGLFKQALLDDPRVEHKGTWTGVELFHGTAPINVRSQTQTP